MTTTKILIAAAVAATVSLPAMAASLNFEPGQGGVDPMGADEFAITGGEYVTDFGVAFSSAGGLNLVKVGGPADGFVPNDTPATSGALGEYFLTSNFGATTDLTIAYDSMVTAASFDLADIDGQQSGASETEVFTFSAFNGAAQVGSTQTITAGDPGTGDQSVLTVGFSGIGAFDRIEISGTTSGGTRNIGIAFDNFNTTRDVTTPVPLPAAAWMLMAGLGGLGFLSRKRKA